MILVVMFLYLFLCSGSVFFAVKANQKFEETVPVTAMGSIFLIFLFGVFGFLKEGLILCFFAAFLMYVLSIVHIIKEKSCEKLKSSFITPGFLIFTASFMVLPFVNNGQMAKWIDEWVHWGYIVKVMAVLDDFGTNPAANASFASYPPGLAIFQYIPQKIGYALGSIDVFCEWFLFFSFQLLVIILLLPLFSELSVKNVPDVILVGVAAYVAPLMIVRYTFRDICIEPIIGALAGAGFSSVFLLKKKNIYYHIRIWLTCSMLVLMKDVGIMYAVFLAIGYGADMLLDQRETVSKKTWVFMICAVVMIVLPYALWKWELSTSEANIMFGDKIDIISLVRILSGNDTTYRAQVIPNYIEAFLNLETGMGHLPVKIKTCIVFIISVFLSVLLCIVYQKKDSARKKVYPLLFALVIAQMVIYICAMPIVYIFKYSEHEALSAASLGRYLSMTHVVNWYMVTLPAAFALIQWGKKRYYAVMIAMIMIVSPIKEFYNLLTGVNVQTAYEYRQNLEPLRAEVSRWCDEDDSVFFIYQLEEFSENFSLFRYNSYPVSVGNMGYLDPESDGKSMQALREMIMESYDYVAVLKIDDNFKENYSGLFSEVSDIENNTVYRVEKQTGMLYKCS